MRLTLVKSAPKPNTNLAHRAAKTEGESARRLMEDQGYTAKTTRGGESTWRCPFHEGPGSVESRKSPNFYLNSETGVYVCHSVSCGERGNLRTLERHFGVGETTAEWTQQFLTREDELVIFERALTKTMRKPFYDQGLTDTTIERFRLGWDAAKHRYVIPYLEGRRPKFFRYYQPKSTPGLDPEKWDPRWKFTWEKDAQSTLFNAQDAMGDADGMVVCCEGEIKAMMLVQLGYAAVAVPGAGQWKPEFQAAFTHARKIAVCFDNDNPAFHIYDNAERGTKCQRCASRSLPACEGHNPGQEAAQMRVTQIGWRARNIVLPLPSEDLRKTDINEYFMRDGHNNADFAELLTGKRQTQFKVMSLQEIADRPPEQGVFLVAEGILPKGGRLLIAGKPKVGKSLLVDNLALSLAAGIPFLNKFRIDHPTRTLLLDRELSKWSLFSRLSDLIEGRPGYRAAMENLLIDHDHLIRLDQPNAYETLLQLIEQNGAEVVMLDTAYKFFGGDVESSASLMKGFDVLDRLLHHTGCSVVLTHHMKKAQGTSGKMNTDIADPDSVSGSFLWTGWPNATVLLNFMTRSVENPYNAVATFTAFRDHAAPEPLALYRARDSVVYTSITPYTHCEEPAYGAVRATEHLEPRTVEALLLDVCPIPEDDFLHIAGARFGTRSEFVRPFLIDLLSQGDFVRTGRPSVLAFKHAEVTQTWEAEHGLPERCFQDVPLFAGAGQGAK